MKKRAVIKILGDVQGVNFRYHTKTEAEKLELVGYASNESDGSVLVVVEGEEEDLKKIIDWCYAGSRGARVNKVEVDWQEPSGVFNNFMIQY